MFLTKINTNVFVHYGIAKLTCCVSCLKKKCHLVALEIILMNNAL